MFGQQFLAIDWGTTNRRVYLVEQGRAVRSERDSRGVTSIPEGGFEAEIATVRASFGDLPILLAGMVGSNVGWREVPYVACPAGIEALATHLTWIDDRTAIVPGLSTVTGGGDVMRGEEVQLLGAVAAGLVPPDSFLCQPGTHCKWAEMRGGEVAEFVTAMTGELFGLIRGHGLLSSQLGGEVVLGDAFRAGLHEGAKRDLGASLFGVRAAKLLGLRDDADAASFASGLLIGADVAARLEGRGQAVVHILADPVLGGFYSAAVAAAGGEARVVDSHDAFFAGIMSIARQLS